MKNLLLLTVLLSLGACNSLEGTFKAKTDLVLKSKKAFSSKYTSVRVPARNYNAEFDFTKFNNLNIKLSGIDKKIRIDISDAPDINQNNDEFFISGSDMRQNYDFDGRITSEVTRSETRRENESCTYTRQERRCHRVCTPDRHGRSNCHNVCNSIPVTVYGRQNVEYYYSTKNTQMRLKVLEPSTSVSVGLFEGNNVSTSRIVTYQSMCR